MSNFEKVLDFERVVSEWFGADYGIAVDSCTHGLELCLRATPVNKISVPKRTYISVPFLANKLNIDLEWRDEDWEDYYNITDNIIDAAVLWRKDSYIPGKLMCISFQFQKQLSLGRGGMILTDNTTMYHILKKMSYDGRDPLIPWREQNISTVGYHYYMTPETATLGMKKFFAASLEEPRKWSHEDYPDLTKMKVFNE